MFEAKEEKRFYSSIVPLTVTEMRASVYNNKLRNLHIFKFWLYRGESNKFF